MNFILDSHYILSPTLKPVFLFGYNVVSNESRKISLISVKQALADKRGPVGPRCPKVRYLLL